jgi:hypothetical protein
VPRFAAFHSDVAHPYPQAVAFERNDRHYAVASGGGGGAAQMLPADLLARVLDTAWRAAAAAWTTEDHLFAFLGGVDAGVVDLRRDRIWAGTTAHAAAAWWDPGEACVWVNGVGHTEAYAVQGSVARVVHRATTLQNVVDRPTGLPDDILVAVLGAWDAPTRPIRIAVAPGDRIVLASHASLGGDAFAALLRDVHDPAELWHAMRERATSLPQFDRRAVIGVVEI